ncbi:hypothetical protein [Lederbergia lenta]|uniref:hypothetical protein n=1 Tax=Lederbergia lenta TaxID=1467 RepID=UPI0020414F83|nr:hypothetical protein [Lederbergia lenta]MCM3113634.1 hypothetical protein [Lederbergia lenta]
MKNVKESKKIYKIAHYYSKDYDKYSVFVESDIDEDSFVKLLGALQFKFEELIDDSESMDERHLICILERFFNMKDITNECKKYLSQTQLNKDEWEMINEFAVIDLDSGNGFTIIQIDLYESREFCCTNGQAEYKKFMDNQLPNTLEFENEIKNKRNFYPWLDVHSN